MIIYNFGIYSFNYTDIKFHGLNYIKINKNNLHENLLYLFM